MTLNITLQYGNVWNLADLPANSVALDGAVQGPEIDGANRQYSFDHHANCLRLVTKATCQQVREALVLGLVIDENTSVYINDIDTDTVMSVWLLTNPEMVNDPHVIEVIDRIGLTDAHGPIFPVHALHTFIEPNWSEKEKRGSMDFLNECLANVSAYFAGELDLPEPEKRPGQGFGWTPNGGWVEITTEDGFGPLYADGVYAAVLHFPGPDGTTNYVVAKRSDLVPYPIGPSSDNSDRGSLVVEDYREDTLLGFLARQEVARNQEQSCVSNWGGGSSIGGSPRNGETQTASVIEPEEMFNLLNEFTLKYS